MIPTLLKTSTTEEQYSAIKEFGIFKIDEFYSPNMIKNLYKETMSIIEKKAGHYEFGHNLRGGKLGNFKNSTHIYKAYSAQWMKDLNEKYIGHNDGYCKEIYATYDYLNDKGLGRNGYLHFDRYWAFKFFIYLTDVDKSNGAFSCVPGSHIKG